jgi:hypothetical protein
MNKQIAKSWTEWLQQNDLGLNEIKPPHIKPTFDELSMLVGELYRLFQLVNELGLGHTAIEKRSTMEDNVFSRAIFIRDQILKPENQQFAGEDSSFETGAHIIPEYPRQNWLDGYGFPVTTPLWDEWEGGLYAEEVHEWELDPRNENREELLEALEASKNLTPSEKMQRTFADLKIQGFHSSFYI